MKIDDFARSLNRRNDEYVKNLKDIGGKMDAAQKHLDEVMRKHPDDPVKIEEARRAYEQAVENFKLRVAAEGVANSIIDQIIDKMGQTR